MQITYVFAQILPISGGERARSQTNFIFSSLPPPTTITEKNSLRHIVKSSVPFAFQKEESLIVTNNWYLVSKGNKVVQGPWLSGLGSTEKSHMNLMLPYQSRKLLKLVLSEVTL